MSSKVRLLHLRVCVVFSFSRCRWETFISLPRRCRPHDFRRILEKILLGQVRSTQEVRFAFWSCLMIDYNREALNRGSTSRINFLCGCRLRIQSMCKICDTSIMSRRCFRVVALHAIHLSRYLAFNVRELIVKLEFIVFTDITLRSIYTSLYRLDYIFSYSILYQDFIL